VDVKSLEVLDERDWECEATLCEETPEAGFVERKYFQGSLHRQIYAE
jgi:hypothetical protein